MSDLSGKTIKDRYRVESLVGRGGMGDVYKVWDDQRAVYLAMKVLHADLAEDKVFLRRFAREAETLSTLQHPHIVRFYGLEQEGRLTFMLMDYIEGTTLRGQIFDAHRPFIAEHVMQIMRPVCSALHYAHQRGRVHCDVKPANIMIKTNGEVLVADFGIARMLESSTTMTMAGAGTPAYMAPEQVLGKQPSPRTDIYSLGIVLYEMLTGGERPFTGDHAKVEGTTSEKVRWEQTRLEPPSPQKFNAAISGSMETVILTCLQKDPAQRHASALELLKAVTSAFGTTETKEESAAEVNRAPVRTSPKAAARGEHKWQQTAAAPGRLPFKPATAIALAVGLLAVTGAVFFLSGGARTSPPPPTATLPALPPGATASQSATAAATTTPTPTALPTQIRDSSGAAMQLVPPGKFTMGSEIHPNESPAHEVFLHNYYIDAFEVTNSQYARCVDSGGCKPPAKTTSHILYCWSATGGGSCWDDPDRRYFPIEEDSPVIFLDWNMANAFCEWRGARLPTEAEWEKAARGTDGRSYPWGNGIDCSRANYSMCYSQKGFGALSSSYHGLQKQARIAAVGAFPLGLSPYGLFDMAGNVWEWVADWYDQNYYRNSPAVDPTGPNSGTQRVYRGGAYMLEGDLQSSTYRNFGAPTMYAYNIGFRCARERDTIDPLTG